MNTIRLLNWFRFWFQHNVSHHAEICCTMFGVCFNDIIKWCKSFSGSFSAEWLINYQFIHPHYLLKAQLDFFVLDIIYSISCKTFFNPLCKKKITTKQFTSDRSLRLFLKRYYQLSFLIDWNTISSPMGANFIQCSLHNWNYFPTKAIELSIMLWFTVDFLP